MVTTANETEIIKLKNLKKQFVEPTYNQGVRCTRLRDFSKKINVLLNE